MQNDILNFWKVEKLKLPPPTLRHHRNYSRKPESRRCRENEEWTILYAEASE